MDDKKLLEYKEERKKQIGSTVKKVKCPCCNNRRLMDIRSAYEAELEIKCQKCGKTVSIVLRYNQIYVKAL